MDKDRVVGSAKQVKGTVKQVVGNAVGDSKLELEGQADKVEGIITWMRCCDLILRQARIRPI